MMVFQEIADATSFWIKGDEFTIEKVLGPLANALADYYVGGSLCIARLAPQDYHRYVCMYVYVCVCVCVCAYGLCVCVCDFLFFVVRVCMFCMCVCARG